MATPEDHVTMHPVGRPLMEGETVTQPDFSTMSPQALGSYVYIMTELASTGLDEARALLHPNERPLAQPSDRPSPWPAFSHNSEDEF